MRILPFLALLALAGPVSAGPPEDARAALALSLASAPAPKPVARADCPCGIINCSCGCRDGKPCDCKRAVEETDKPYAAEYRADGWTWHAEGGYWIKYPPAAPAVFQAAPQSYQSQPAMSQPQQSQSFGSGGRRGGGRRGGC